VVAYPSVLRQRSAVIERDHPDLLPLLAEWSGAYPHPSPHLTSRPAASPAAAAGWPVKNLSSYGAATAVNVVGDNLACAKAHGLPISPALQQKDATVTVKKGGLRRAAHGGWRYTFEPQPVPCGAAGQPAATCSWTQFKRAVTSRVDLGGCCARDEPLFHSMGCDAYHLPRAALPEPCVWYRSLCPAATACGGPEEALDPPVTGPCMPLYSRWAWQAVAAGAVLTLGALLLLAALDCLPFQWKETRGALAHKRMLALNSDAASINDEHAQHLLQPASTPASPEPKKKRVTASERDE
jgi:hypothetical protein